MKNLIKKFLVFCAVLFSVTTVTSTTFTSSVSAASDCRYFLGMASWDCHVDTEDINNETKLTNSIWLIATNVLSDLIIIAAYLVMGYVIYGGYQYIFASGDPGKVMKGKKTILHAFIGLAIVMSSFVIVNAIHMAVLGGSGSFGTTNCAREACIDPFDAYNNIVQWVIGISGVTALIFVVVGGVGYVTSSGDAGKLQKAKNTITYALIGLALVALAEVITIFVSNIIRDAGADASASLPTTTLIAKESHEIHLH